MCSRIVGPPGSHCVAVRCFAIWATWIRLSKPPQLEPMPKSFSALTNASTARSLTGISHEREQRGRAVEIALPDLVAGIVLQRGIDHALHVRALLQPARDRERALHLLLHAHADGAKAAQRQVAVVGAHAEAVVGDGLAHRQPVALVGDDRCPSSRRNGPRCTWSPRVWRHPRPARTSGSSRACPRCCPRARVCRARAPLPRSPECPASRR